MFGLTFEKLFLVAIIAGFVLGPSRLPGYAQQLGRAVRSVRQFVDTTRSAAEDEMGVPLRRSQWETMDVRQYDPRRIVADALRETDVAPSTEWPDEVLAEADRVRPGQKYLITGPSSHPRRILIDSLPENDPRRIAAQVIDECRTAG
ncbi:preprotein translocase [Rhodococcus sp. 06-412-2C]|uniref:preprotein translocase n=1 Tax=unclassified Rhodococcus (in: high G+C Gram-positive bacteria) TaxID=192944 RepID=UPI000B9B218D|nr:MULTISPECIES: preprotein translocase [unclassified Rhodococcus (in: high G+C Gram-positive bacteria)]OZC83674.1 preprotein translocase [Rhodococcus sp. 06-412-2C]OZC93861.1 preprotein translocase [Rhodococcus sp. 06-412-2B]